MTAQAAHAYLTIAALGILALPFIALGVAGLVGIAAEIVEHVLDRRAGCRVVREG